MRELDLALEHVSFTYPGSTRRVLDDGAIFVDDTPLARIPADAWRERLAGAFQDFFRFELVARLSVGLGDVLRLEQAAAVRGAVDRAGAADVVERLPAGLDTQLGPTWPGGVEMSLGQWQKLALARGFMRDQPLLLVLDEPTAALDAETEHALFERYAAAAHQGANGGRITLLVSHRFSTVRMADCIVVLDGARLAEVGTHSKPGHAGERSSDPINAGIPPAVALTLECGPAKLDHMRPAVKTVAAVVFKAKCLALLDEVAESGQHLVVTKRGRPVARIVPVSEGSSVSLKGTLLAQKDIVSPIDAAWEADET